MIYTLLIYFLMTINIVGVAWLHDTPQVHQRKDELQIATYLRYGLWLCCGGFTNGLSRFYTDKWAHRAD
jgi:hypothetical protein